MAQFLDVDTSVGTNDIASLAQKLVQRLGVQDALRMCQENSWYGVFNFIKGHTKIDGQ